MGGLIIFGILAPGRGFDGDDARDAHDHGRLHLRKCEAKAHIGVRPSLEEKRAAAGRRTSGAAARSACRARKGEGAASCVLLLDGTTCTLRAPAGMKDLRTSRHALPRRRQSGGMFAKLL